MAWLRHLFNRRRRYNELSESIREHLDDKIADLVEGGMPPRQAEQTARREFGNVTLIEERSREQWQWPQLESIWADFRYAFRQLLKSPGIAVAVILTLALGVGAATAVFSVAYGVLIDPFPYKDVHTLATPKICSPQLSYCFWDEYTPQEFLEIERDTHIFSGVTASTIGDVTLTGGPVPQRIRGNFITPNTFNVLGVRPILGRASTQDDVQPDHGEVALISYRYWQAQYGGKHSVLGQTITVNGRLRTIIGVMPPRFLWRGADVYLPIRMIPARQIQGNQRFALVGRLKPGVTQAQASAELQPVFQDFLRKDPLRYPGNLRLGFMRFDRMFQSGLASTLYLLLGAVLVLLLIACVNVSALLLARAVRREHEFVVRAAIGASRARLVRNALAESLLLAFFAMPVALAFAYLGLQITARIVPTDTIPNEAVITLNLPVLFVSIGIALFTILLSAVLPAWHNANPRLAAALNGMRVTGSRAQRRWLHGFVVAEIALSLTLLTLAGLMMRSMITVQSAPVNFSPDHTLMMRVPLDSTRYPKPEDRIQFFRQILTQLRHLPGVKSATLDSQLPFLGGMGVRIQVGSQPVHQNDYSNLHLVSPAYRGIAQESMLQGHFIDAREISDQSHDAVVTQNFVKHYFHGGNALGQTVRLVDLQSAQKTPINNAFTIVGIMQNLPEYPGYRENYPNIFLPYTVAPIMDTVVVSTYLPADKLVRSARRVVYSIDKDQPVTDAMSLRHLLNVYGYAGPRFSLALFGTFAAAALLLSLIGIYGVLSFVTSQRTQEIGIRMALGADRATVMWLVLRQAFILAILGIGAGLPLAFVAGHLAKSELFHTSQFDPATFFGVICVLPLVAIAGTWFPARRAAAVDPMRALRTE